MAAGKGLLLLAVSVFEACPALEQALSELHGEGFGAREMCLVGTASAFDEIVKRPTRPLLPRSGRPLYQRERHRLPWLVSGADVLGTSGILMRTLVAQASAERNKLVPPSACLIETLSARLLPYLERDAIALLVSAPDHSHQTRGARVLLRHSSQPVLTYAVHLALTSER